MSMGKSSNLSHILNPVAPTDVALRPIPSWGQALGLTSQEWILVHSGSERIESYTSGRVSLWLCVLLFLAGAIIILNTPLLLLGAAAVGFGAIFAAFQAGRIDRMRSVRLDFMDSFEKRSGNKTEIKNAVVKIVSFAKSIPKEEQKIVQSLLFIVKDMR